MALNFSSDHEEANWCERQASFCEEQAKFLRDKYPGMRWAAQKVEIYEQQAEYFRLRQEDLHEGSDEDDGGVEPIRFDDERPPF